MVLANRAIRFPYRTEAAAGCLEIRYPFELSDEEARLAPAIGLGVAAYLAQLSLAREVVLGFPVTDSAIGNMAPLIAMLYDVRRWKDGLPLGEYPDWTGTSAGAPAPSTTAPVPSRALLLFSGGKDSTLGAILLKQNGYEVVPVHITANAGVERRELRAMQGLSKLLGLDPLIVEFRHDDFLEFSTRYATSWNQYPLCNTVPFGRDLLLALIAAPVAMRTSCAHISMAHDHECRNAYVTHNGKRFPRNDVESVEGALALEAFLKAEIWANVGLLPPVAGLTELRILYEMIVNHPQAFALTSSCFWGTDCGRCAKCLRYYLAQRLFDSEIRSYARNPLAEGSCPELDEMMSGDFRRALFGEQVLLCLSALHARGDTRADESHLKRFRVSPSAGNDPTTLIDGFLATTTDPQVPEDFCFGQSVPSFSADSPTPREGLLGAV